MLDASAGASGVNSRSATAKHSSAPAEKVMMRPLHARPDTTARSSRSHRYCSVACDQGAQNCSSNRAKSQRFIPAGHSLCSGTATREQRVQTAGAGGSGNSSPHPLQQRDVAVITQRIRESLRAMKSVVISAWVVSGVYPMSSSSICLSIPFSLSPK